MLRLPGPDDELPPLVNSPQPEAEPIEVEKYDEEDSDEAVTAARSDRNFIAFLAVAAVILVGLVAWWMMPEEKAPAAVVNVTENQPAPPPPDATTGGSTTDGKGAVAIEQPKPLFLEIESVVKSFLDAKTREEMLAQVLDPDSAARKWDGWLPGESYTAPGFQGLVNDPVTTGVGEGATSIVQVRTGDYKVHEIALVKRDGKLRVDWDSWAAWSEMTWEDFRAKKPVEPVLFRVQLSVVDYFNFDFSNDREWSSYRLDSQDGMESLYGYVERTGTLDQRLRPADPGAVKRWTLKLKFPPNATRDSQVLIDSVVAEGWLLAPQGKE